jgi:60S ribosome subunit biogenesis protein NIP7
VWVKPQSEMSFLYGNNVAKSGLGRMTEGIPQYAGVVVYSMTDVPLGGLISELGLGGACLID